MAWCGGVVDWDVACKYTTSHGPSLVALFPAGSIQFIASSSTFLLLFSLLLHADHERRLTDDVFALLFVVKVKEYIEDPRKMLLA